MRAAITGATGLVGSNLAVLLCEQGVEVRCTHRRSSRRDHLDGLPLRWLEAELNDVDALARAFDDVDVVYHCAASVEMRRHPTSAQRQANLDGTRNVLAAARRSGARRLVHCSSVVTCAIAEGEADVTEEDRWNFPAHGLDDGYAVTKRESEELVRDAAAELDVVVVNPGFMIGPYDPKPSSGRLVLAVLDGRLFFYTEGYNNFVDVRDVCRGMTLAAERGRRGERYILGGENLRFQEAFARIAAVVGKRPPRFGMPKALGLLGGWLGELGQAVLRRELDVNLVTARYGYCRGYRFSSAKAERELGYSHGPLEDAVRDALAWFRARGMA